VEVRAATVTPALPATRENAIGTGEASEARGTGAKMGRNTRRNDKRR